MIRKIFWVIRVSIANVSRPCHPGSKIAPVFKVLIKVKDIICHFKLATVLMNLKSCKKCTGFRVCPGKMPGDSFRTMETQVVDLQGSDRVPFISYSLLQVLSNQSQIERGFGFVNR